MTQQPGPISSEQPVAVADALPMPARAAVIVRPGFLNALSGQLFRLGFASIFLINSVYAALEPASFTQLLYDNPITNAIGFENAMVKIAMFNDLLLGMLILVGWRKKFTYAWAGVWLLIVAGIKLMNLFTG